MPLVGVDRGDAFVRRCRDRRAVGFGDLALYVVGSFVIEFANCYVCWQRCQVGIAVGIVSDLVFDTTRCLVEPLGFAWICSLHHSVAPSHIDGVARLTGAELDDDVEGAVGLDTLLDILARNLVVVPVHVELDFAERFGEVVPVDAQTVEEQAHVDAGRGTSVEGTYLYAAVAASLGTDGGGVVGGGSGAIAMEVERAVSARASGGRRIGSIFFFESIDIGRPCGVAFVIIMVCVVGTVFVGLGKEVDVLTLDVVPAEVVGKVLRRTLGGVDHNGEGLVVLDVAAKFSLVCSVYTIVHRIIEVVGILEVEVLACYIV